MNGDRNEVERYMAFCVTNISENKIVFRLSCSIFGNWPQN